MMCILLCRVEMDILPFSIKVVTTHLESMDRYSTSIPKRSLLEYILARMISMLYTSLSNFAKYYNNTKQIKLNEYEDCF